MVESRNATLDGKLKNSFGRLYRGGTRHISAEIIQESLTSGELKLKKKSANIAGLQLADLLAHPAQHDLLAECGIVESLESEYGREIARILRGHQGRVYVRCMFCVCPLLSRNR